MMSSLHQSCPWGGTGGAWKAAEHGSGGGVAAAGDTLPHRDSTDYSLHSSSVGTQDRISDPGTDSAVRSVSTHQHFRAFDLPRVACHVMHHASFILESSPVEFR